MRKRYILSADEQSIIDTHNHNSVEVMARTKETAKKIVDSLNLEETKKPKHDIFDRATTWDKSTKHGIGTRRI